LQTQTLLCGFKIARLRQFWFSSAMLKLRVFLVYWLPVVLWMLLIFGGSGDSSSFQHSSRIIGPFVHWLFPNLPEEQVRDIVVAVRKCAHLTEYAILAMLLWRAKRKPLRKGFRTWLWRDAGWALLLSAIYAATDEFHQTFVPSREGCLRDVIIDTLGAAAGLLALWVLGRWRKRW
jgi:VanZ family protein